MYARHSDIDGFAEHRGVKIYYEVHGDGGPTILLMPTWTIVHRRIWKAQAPRLAAGRWSALPATSPVVEDRPVGTTARACGSTAA